MEPFNIKITYGTHEVTLTILPEEDYYKVIYYGGVLGAVMHDGRDWELIPLEQMTGGDLPFYEPGRPGERVEVQLNDYAAERIGWEIELHKSEDQELPT